MTVNVRARNIRKVYGEGDVAYHALRGVDLDVAAGEFMMLAGPSGSGKTTLLSILGCVLSATSGSLELFGEDISKLLSRPQPDRVATRSRQRRFGDASPGS
jgi:putative ABC transport system ATP-binding protein